MKYLALILALLFSPQLFSFTDVIAQTTGLKILPLEAPSQSIFGFAMDAHRGRLLVGGPTDCVPRQEGSVSALELNGVEAVDMGMLTGERCLGYALDFDGIYAVSGQPFGNDHSARGEAAVLKLIDDTWHIVSYLSPQVDIANGFGTAVAIDGNRITVGAPLTNTVYVFEKDGDNWPLRAVLTPPDSNPSARFGHSLDIEGNTIVVGAPGTTTDVDPIYEMGAAYVFVFDGGEWRQTAQLTQSFLINFGYAVGLVSDLIVVGAPSSLTALSSGAVQLFGSVDGVWTEGQTLNYSGGGIRFGSSISVASGVVFVGAPGAFGGPGSAHVFRLEGAEWNQTAHFISEDETGEDEFGHDVAMTGGYFFVGAPFDAEAGPEAGAIYLFQEDGNLPTGSEDVPGLTVGHSILIFPDPGRGDRTMRILLAEPSRVKVELFDMLGSRRGMLLERWYPSGEHQISIPLHIYGSGTYVLRVSAGGHTSSHSISHLN